MGDYETKAERFDHIDGDEMAIVEGSTTDKEAMKQVGLLIVDEMKEINHRLWQLERAIKEV